MRRFKKWFLTMGLVLVMSFSSLGSTYAFLGDLFVGIPTSPDDPGVWILPISPDDPDDGDRIGPVDPVPLPTPIPPDEGDRIGPVDPVLLPTPILLDVDDGDIGIPPPPLDGDIGILPPPVDGDIGIPPPPLDGDIGILIGEHPFGF